MRVDQPFTFGASLQWQADGNAIMAPGLLKCTRCQQYRPCAVPNCHSRRHRHRWRGYPSYHCHCCCCCVELGKERRQGSALPLPDQDFRSAQQCGMAVRTADNDDRHLGCTKLVGIYATESEHLRTKDSMYLSGSPGPISVLRSEMLPLKMNLS